MVKQERTRKHKQRKYNRYSREIRLKLIHLVRVEGQSKTSSAKKLSICQTSARLILKTWEQEERVFEKKGDREKRARKERSKERRKRERDELNKRKKRRPRVAQIEESSPPPPPPTLPPLKVEEEESPFQNMTTRPKFSVYWGYYNYTLCAFYCLPPTTPFCQEEAAE